jgi:hypothetical protein
MGKCLVTKLNGSSNNSDLLRIGEMRIKFNKVSNPTAITQCIKLNVARGTKLEIIGDGYFTDSSLAQNKGKNLTITANTNTKVYVSNNDIELAILDKYAIAAIFVEENFNGNAAFDIDFLKYSTQVTNLYLNNIPVYGDIAALKNLTALTNINLSNTNVSGDIAALKNLTALTNLNAISTQLSGDISALKNLTALTNLNAVSTQLFGDIAAFKNLTNLTGLRLSNTNISGDIVNLKNLTKIATVEFKNVAGLTGDMGTLPDNILFFTGGSGKFTWTTSSRTYILATENAHCDKIDDMLNDMATKTAKFAGEQTWYKTISLIGSRTSASDAAIQTLQSKGYTVSITPA